VKDKANEKDKPSEGSLERTARLAKKLLAVPKAEVDKAMRKQPKRPRS
jgi:hypothetical protein